MKTKEFAAACGVEKRTLFYYDEIGLLKPSHVGENGYREYDEQQIPRMETIKLLQSVGLTLREIRSVLLIDGKDSVGSELPKGERNLAVVQDCCRRIGEQRARLLDAEQYLRQRMLIRQSYVENVPGGAASPTEYGEAVLVFEELPEQPIATLQPTDLLRLKLKYSTLGYYLGIVLDLATGEPKYVFKYADEGCANASRPGGRYASVFYTADAGKYFDIKVLTKDFSGRLAALGLEFDGVAYAEDLPVWILDRSEGFICRFSARVIERNE